MKRVLMALTAAAGCALATGLQAADSKPGEELASKNACMACHSIDKKLVGPGFKDIAAKYRGQSDAGAMLRDKIKKGSVGTWGQIPMPPNGQVGDEDIKTLVDWILAIE